MILQCGKAVSARGWSSVWGKQAGSLRLGAAQPLASAALLGSGCLQWQLAGFCVLIGFPSLSLSCSPFRVSWESPPIYVP